MHLLLLTAAIALLLASAVILLLRSFATTCAAYVESCARIDFSWRDYPMRRLLDPADFAFLRNRGIGRAQIRALRSERRQIFRLCLRSLARDFNHAQWALQMIVVQSPQDRPDLVAQIARQKLAFYRNMLLIEGWLFLHAAGCDRMPSVELLEPLRILQVQLRELAPAYAPALSGA